MFKLLFLPRGYLTLFVLFWTYQNGWWDSWPLSDLRPATTCLIQWLKPLEISWNNANESSGRPDAGQHEVLKLQILEELSKYDFQSSPAESLSPEPMDSNRTISPRREILWDFQDPSPVNSR
ncbi:MAG: hypothetical protein HUJ26_09320 [Planctomycetaceae bacterium]|nr:hypothetical protein [Planctomycetaceae bacterium]